MKQSPPNQIFRQFLGVSGLNPFDFGDSASRKQMFASHAGQALVMKGGTERIIQTGMEREIAHYTFSIKMPVDAQIIRSIPRYREQVGADYIPLNPQTVVIYENTETKEVDILNLTNYCSYHQYFGFEYKPSPNLSEVRPGAFIAKNTILLDSPSVTPDGGYKYGIQLNMAFMSHPGVSEDGIVICRDVLPRLAFKTYERRVIEWGSKRFPLNLYGDTENYKPFPDIGDRVRDDGILMALRTYDPMLAPVEQGINDVRDVQITFDRTIYAAGAGGKIVDVIFQHDRQNYQNVPGRDDQPEKYDAARVRFSREIMEEYDRLRKSRGDGLKLSREFHRLLVESLGVVNDDEERIAKLYRQVPLDDWRVELVIEYDVVPTVGFKFTDCHGG